MACTSSRTVNCGKIRAQVSWYDITKKDYVPIPVFLEILYQDSFVIQNTQVLKIVSYFKDSTIMTAIPSNSYIIDLRSMCFFKYSSFSDTATLLGDFTISKAEAEGVWVPFFNNSIDSTIGKLNVLSDTVILGVSYRRIKATEKAEGSNTSESIFYLRCDMKGSMFGLYASSLTTFDCPIWRRDYLPAKLEKPVPSIQLIHMADSLSQHEQNIFATWRKQIAKISCL